MCNEEQEPRFAGAVKREDGQSIIGEEFAVQLRNEAHYRIRNAGGNAVVFVFGEDTVTGAVSCEDHEMKSVIHYLLTRHPQLTASILADICSEKEE